MKLSDEEISALETAGLPIPPLSPHRGRAECSESREEETEEQTCFHGEPA